MLSIPPASLFWSGGYGLMAGFWGVELATCSSYYHDLGK
jgi:hypothetical protein